MARSRLVTMHSRCLGSIAQAYAVLVQELIVVGYLTLAMQV